jgi:hypothetical protein
MQSISIYNAQVSPPILIEFYREPFPDLLSVFHDNRRHRHQKNRSTSEDCTSPSIPQFIVHRGPEEWESSSDHGAEKRPGGDGRCGVAGKCVDEEVLRGIKDADCSDTEKDRS